MDVRASTVVLASLSEAFAKCHGQERRLWPILVELCELYLKYNIGIIGAIYNIGVIAA